MAPIKWRNFVAMMGSALVAPVKTLGRWPETTASQPKSLQKID